MRVKTFMCFDFLLSGTNKVVVVTKTFRVYCFVFVFFFEIFTEKIILNEITEQVSGV